MSSVDGMTSELETTLTKQTGLPWSLQDKHNKIYAEGKFLKGNVRKPNAAFVTLEKASKAEQVPRKVKEQ